MEDDKNGRRPKLKTPKIEDEQNGRLPIWKLTKMEENIKKYKNQELCNTRKNVERSICPPLRHFSTSEVDFAKQTYTEQ